MPPTEDDLPRELPDMRGPSDPAPVRASIIVPLYGGLEYTKACVLALGEAWDERDELILVDNASPDRTAEFLDEIEDRAVVVRNERNRNFSGGCNDGADRARGATLVFLNNDVIVLPGWLDPVLGAAAQPGVGVVGTLLRYPDGSVQHAGVAMSSNLEEVAIHVHARRAADLPVVRRPREMQAVTAACFAVPRDRFAALGGFDEGFINGLEDVDLCLRARQVGLRVRYEPSVGPAHFESVSDGRFQHAQHNVERFLARWGASIVPDAHAHDDALLPRMAYPAGVDTVAADPAMALGPALNRAMCEGVHERLVVTLADTAPAGWLGGLRTSAEHVDATRGVRVVARPDAPATIGAIVLPRDLLYAIGGLDLALDDPLEQLTDWLDRARLHGWAVVDDTDGALPTPTPWFCSAATVGREQDPLVRRWGAIVPGMRRRAIYEPLVWERQLEHAATDLDLRTRAAFLPWAGDPGAFAAALETLLTKVATTDDVSVVVRVDPDDPRGIDILDEVADRVAAQRDLPDVVLVNGGPEQDLALASAVDVVIDLPGPAGGRIASIAHAAGCAAAPAEDAAMLLGVPLDSMPLPELPQTDPPGARTSPAG